MVCEQENFIEFISTEYAPKINLEYFDKASELRKQETVDYINDAFSRYANAQTMEDLGLKNNALFFAICISCKILEEMSPT